MKLFVPKPTATHKPTVKDRSWGAELELMIYDASLHNRNSSSSTTCKRAKSCQHIRDLVPREPKAEHGTSQVKKKQTLCFLSQLHPCFMQLPQSIKTFQVLPAVSSSSNILQPSFWQSKCLGICLDSGIGSPSLDWPVDLPSDLPRNFESSSSTWGQDWTSGNRGPITLSHGYTK